MSRIVLSLAVILSMAAGLGAQDVTLTVSPDPVPTGQKITITVSNETNASINLVDGAPFSLIRIDGRVFDLPVGGGGKILDSGEFALFTWDQKLGLQRVAPGVYTLQVEYIDGAGRFATSAGSFRISEDRLDVVGAAVRGQVVELKLNSPAAPDQMYQVACSLHSSPGIDLADNRLLELFPDPLFFMSIFGNNAIFQDFSGGLDEDGAATATMIIPGDASVVGVQLHVAYVTLDPDMPSGISRYSASQSITIEEIATHD